MRTTLQVVLEYIAVSKTKKCYPNNATPVAWRNKRGLQMINLLNQKVRDINGQIYVIEKQNDKFIALSNGKTYDYVTMFSSKAFVIMDSGIQEKVEMDIENILKEKDEKTKSIKEKAEIEREWQKVEDLINCKSIGRDVSCEYGIDLAMHTEFVYKKQYGGKALTIYENGIKHLYFNPVKKHFFDLQQILYAQDCTKEGYSVWMLPYSTLNGKSNGSWANFIEIENKEIIQYAFVKDPYLHEPDEKRLAFVKQKNGNYVFLGVYYLKKRISNYFNNGKCVAKEIYGLLSENYPE